MNQEDTVMLSRLLKILERSIKAVDESDVSQLFPRQVAKEHGTEVTSSPTKQKKVASLETEQFLLSADKVDTLKHTFNVVAESLNAVEAVIALLASDQLPKQVRK